ncbi:MAG: hypothetical protein IJP62_02950 [Treponema sp.]|nr:hypothetical protein [Treponema sp.]
MNNKYIRIALLGALIVLAGLSFLKKTKDGTSESVSVAQSVVTQAVQNALTVTENGEYDGKDEVALYIHTFSHLPANYITKKEAQTLGWTGGGLEKYAAGKSIGGDTFGNREGNLPKEKGRRYTECDIDTRGKKSRGAKRIVFSNDGLIYYTADHYEHFDLLYDKQGKVTVQGKN